jgi:hypothetical protein
MALVKCRRCNVIVDRDLQCECGNLPPHLSEGERLCVCKLVLPAADLRCWSCGEERDGAPAAATDPAGALVVRFPWGEWRHPGGEVLVGRDPQSPFAAMLADYPAVSREHVLIGWADGEGYVLERGRASKHGTFVNGVRAALEQRMPLPPGSVLRLGLRFTAEVVGAGTP